MPFPAGPRPALRSAGESGAVRSAARASPVPDRCGARGRPIADERVATRSTVESRSSIRRNLDAMDEIALSSSHQAQFLACTRLFWPADVLQRAFTHEFVRC